MSNECVCVKFSCAFCQHLTEEHTELAGCALIGCPCNHGPAVSGECIDCGKYRDMGVLGMTKKAKELLDNMDATGGFKLDQGKLRWDLVQPLVLEEYVKVLTFGAKKYAPNNWRKVDDQKSRYFAALMRHIWAWWRGEQRDPETGFHHLAHAMCCVAFLAEPELESSVVDPEDV